MQFEKKLLIVVFSVDTGVLAIKFTLKKTFNWCPARVSSVIRLAWSPPSFPLTTSQPSLPGQPTCLLTNDTVCGCHKNSSINNLLLFPKSWTKTPRFFSVWGRISPPTQRRKVTFFQDWTTALPLEVPILSLYYNSWLKGATRTTSAKTQDKIL